MPAPAPGVTVKANLESVLGAGFVGGFLRITLCGFGATIPRVSGAGVIADAGIPLLAGPQADGAHPVTQLIWGNDLITPAGTFYEIAILSSTQEVIQAGMYQFVNTAGTVDLAGAQQLVGPAGVAPDNIAYLPCTGAVPGAVYVSPGPVIGVTYNGAFMPEGEALPTLSYTVALDQVTITLNFATELRDRVDAFCIL